MDRTARKLSHLYCSEALSKGRGAKVLQEIETVQRLIHIIQVHLNLLQYILMKVIHVCFKDNKMPTSLYLIFYGCLL